MATATLGRRQNFLEKLLAREPIIMQLLRFIAIGILNTALDFIILNLISKWFHVTVGGSLAGLNIISFSAATVQSYIWNRYWAFSGDAMGESLFQKFWHLVVVGALGLIAFIAVLYGAKVGMGPFFYLVILIAFLVAELMLWHGFALQRGATPAKNASVLFVTFLMVSFVGLIINSAIVALVSAYLSAHVFSINVDLLKNLAKIAATGVSLIWNFIGYKLIVFKK